jgi:hypothetical protein
MAMELTLPAMQKTASPACLTGQCVDFAEDGSTAFWFFKDERF